MDVFTVGKTNHKGYNLRLMYIPKELFSDEMNSYNSFKIIFIEKGSGIAYINTNRCIFTAPTLFFIKDTETISVNQNNDITARSLYFHPGIINKAFTFENINEMPSGLNGVDYDDTYWLRAFILRTPSYIGQLSIGPSLIQRITYLFNTIGTELEEQKDLDWPCRSRSFLFELLFVLQQQIYSLNQESIMILSDKDTEIDPVILHLHTNYRQKITVTDLSRMFNMNRTTLEKKFKETTGLSIISYLIKLRIELSSKFLRDTLLPISEILDRTGFNDRTHFNRIFSKYTGYSPSGYREKFCWMK